MQSTRFAPIDRLLVVGIIGASLTMLVIAAFKDPGLHLWQLHSNVYLLIPFAALLISFVLLGIMLRRPLHSEEMQWLYVYLFLSIMVCISEALQKLSGSPTGAIFWSNLFMPTLFLSPAALLFAVTYTNRTPKRLNALTALVVVAGLAFVYFELLLGYLPYTKVQYLSLTPWGWDFAVHVARATWELNVVPFLWVLGLSGIAIHRLYSFRRQSQSALLRRQSLIYICGVALPLVAGAGVASLAFFFPHLSLPSFNSLISLISAAILVYGIYKYHLTTISPTQFSETILSLMREAVVVLDTDYRLLYVNPTAGALLGIKTVDTSQTFMQFLTPESVTTLRSADSQRRSGQKEFTIDQLDIISANAAAPTPVHATASDLRLTDFVGRIMVLTDISSEVHTRKIIEHEVLVRTQQLHRIRANLVASIGSLQQGFLLVNANGIVELANDRVGALFGVDTQQMVSKPLSSFTPKATWRPALGPAIERLLTHDKAKKLAFSSSDGSFYAVYLTPVTLGSQLLGATVVIEDVTEQKILDRSRDEFFSIASHELRTPLTAIRGNMSMAKDYFADALKDPTLHDLIDDTHAASIRLIAIVNDFLDSSQLEQGKMIFEIAPVRIVPLLQSVISDLAMVSTHQRNVIMVDQSIARLPPVMADSSRLRQIFYNLLSNANTYTSSGRITISGSADDGNVSILVADTGKGISLENQKLLFRKFQQAGDSILTRDNTKGTGLGLYISRLMAINMHGSVTLAHSEEGIGSVFAVNIPAAPSKAAHS